jgi:hypothetical protein
MICAYFRNAAISVSSSVYLSFEFTKDKFVVCNDSYYIYIAKNLSPHQYMDRKEMWNMY